VIRIGPIVCELKGRPYFVELIDGRQNGPLTLLHHVEVRIQRRRR